VITRKLLAGLINPDLVDRKSYGRAGISRAIKTAKMAVLGWVCDL